MAEANSPRCNQMTSSQTDLLKELLAFIHDEQRAGDRNLIDVWSRPVIDKVETGWSQRFTRLERADDAGSLWAYLADGESRFREGDMLALHTGTPLVAMLGRGLTLESEEDDRWLLRGNRAGAVLDAYAGGITYADPDAMDLTPYYVKALGEISTSQIGLGVVLPLLSGALEITFDDRDVADGERVALAEDFNAKQAEAVGLAFGAEQVACIQGPPGTGKTRVLARERDVPAAFVVVYADGRFPMADKVRSAGWRSLVAAVAGRAIPLHAVSYQQLLQLAGSVALPDDVVALDKLSKWLDRKVGEAGTAARGRLITTISPEDGTPL